MLFHSGKGSVFHFVLEEIQHFNFELGVKLGFLEDVQFSDNSVKGLNLHLGFRAGGGDSSYKGDGEGLEHFINYLMYNYKTNPCFSA